MKRKKGMKTPGKTKKLRINGENSRLFLHRKKEHQKTYQSWKKEIHNIIIYKSELVFVSEDD
jgi:hypothetical protein